LRNGVRTRRLPLLQAVVGIVAGSCGVSDGQH
jgi:hypothetical protein